MGIQTVGEIRSDRTSSPASARRALPACLGAWTLCLMVVGSAGAAGPEPAHPVASKAPRSTSRYGPVELYAVNSKETLQLRLRDDQGRPLRGVQKRFDYLMRCHHTKTQHPMNPRLVRMMYQIGKHYPGRRIEVISGYRHPSVAKNPRSPHMRGLACDIRISGVKNSQLREYLRAGFKKVGVGYYPNSAFVHLDVRPDRSAFWIDYSGPGERAIYSEDAAGDLKSGRADSYKPTKINSSWVTEPDELGDDAKPARDDGPAGTPDDQNRQSAGSAGGPTTRQTASAIGIGSGAAAAP